MLGVTSVDIRGRATLLTSIAGRVGTHSITAFYNRQRQLQRQHVEHAALHDYAKRREHGEPQYGVRF